MAKLSKSARCLVRYLDEHGHSARSFAEIVGVSHTSVRHWLSGERCPHPVFAAEIERVTKRAVKAEGWGR